jgi:hypothetical protein
MMRKDPIINRIKCELQNQKVDVKEVKTLEDFDMIKSDMKSEDYYVYILACNARTIATGHGKRNRAKVIFDPKEGKTTCHKKSIFIRACNVLNTNGLKRYFVKCKSKEEAEEIEKNLHKVIKGNESNIEVYREKFFPLAKGNPLGKSKDINEIADVVTAMAFHSGYDGINDLRKWRTEKLISEEVCMIIEKKLNHPLNFIRPKSRNNHEE